MALDTALEVRSLVFYQVFPRNHGPSGTLADVTADLPRIRDLGVDVVYLMPIHPIGEHGRKGRLGSPYAIRDYRAIDPDLGTDRDFDDLIDNAHRLGLKVMMDVVFNHTSIDSVLVTEHPEFFHRDDTGRPISTVPAWTDVIDLKHPHEVLTRSLIDTLALWVDRGVDGFRCDVASLVPLDVWMQARIELATRNPHLLLLAETPHPSWVSHRRAHGLPTWSDAEGFAAFDIEYTYDVWSIWQAVVAGREPVGRYLEMLRWQDATLPAGYAKLRYVENHDQFRIMRFAPTRSSALAWTALMAFSRGPLLVYAGQESGARKWPTLFDPAPIAWGDYRLTGFIRSLTLMKKHDAVRGGEFWILDDAPVVQCAWARSAEGVVDPAFERLGPVGRAGLYGLFNVAGHRGRVDVQLPDGTYPDLISGRSVEVRGGRLRMPGPAVVLEFESPFDAPLWRSSLLDVFLQVEELGD